MQGSSWLRRRLFLGWALLLGLLACRVEGCCQQPAEDGCCRNHVPCCAHQPRPVEHGCSHEEASLSDEGGEPDPWDSEEHAEFLSELQRRHWEEAAAYRPIVIPDYFKGLAVSYYNSHNHGSYFRHLEDTHLKVKKALGTMAFLRLILEKTSCTRDKQRERHVTYTNDYLDSQACGLPPESEQEKMDCTFEIFIDARSGRQAVVSHSCISLRSFEESSSEYLK